MSEEEKGVEALRAELELHKAELKKLKDQINPPKREPWVHNPPDYTAGMSMSRSAMQAMIDAVPESVMRGIREDARKPNPIAASQSPITTSTSAQPQPTQRGSGWREEIPLSSPPGVALADRLMDHQDAKDRAELIERELKIAKLTKDQR